MRVVAGAGVPHIGGIDLTDFPKDPVPAQYATYFWSVIAVDAAHRLVLPNPQKRHLTEMSRVCANSFRAGRLWRRSPRPNLGSCSSTCAVRRIFTRVTFLAR